MIKFFNAVFAFICCFFEGIITKLGTFLLFLFLDANQVWYPNQIQLLVVAQNVLLILTALVILFVKIKNALKGLIPVSQVPVDLELPVVLGQMGILFAGLLKLFSIYISKI